MSALVDAEARRQIREDLDATLVVEAAAGTGKTTMLVARIIALVQTGRTTLERIIAVTFTDKAAGEMKLRLREEVERARRAEGTDEAARANLDRALKELEVARISTIHGLCADLLRERPVEAEVDPLFEVGSETRALRLYDQAFDTWFRGVVADPPEGVRRLLRRKFGSWEPGARERLRRAGLSLIDHRDFDTPWRRDPFERDAAIDALIDGLRELAELADRGYERDNLTQSLREIRRFVVDLDRREALREGEGGARDYDGLEGELLTLSRSKAAKWTHKGKFQRYYCRGVERSWVLERRAAVKALLDELIARAGADMAALLRDELSALVSDYETLKARTGTLDFLDLLLRVRDLVKTRPRVRRELQERFSHILIDEFQDTDPLQAEILLLLAARDPDDDDWQRAEPAPGKLFVVGDPKQSIYRFRRADMTLYQAIKRRLLARGAQVVYLRTSFRARPAIQSAINAAFALEMQGDSDAQAEYVALERFRPPHPASSQPAVVALPVPTPYGRWGKVWSGTVEQSLPDAVGAFVAWLVHESGWTVEEDGALVPVAPRHVCLLFRRLASFRGDVTRPYTLALEQRQVPHVHVGGRSFHERAEVLAIKNVLAAIEWPDDELSVFAALKGPFFALDDAALMTYRHRHRRLNPTFGVEPTPETAPVADALEVLARMHRSRNRRPIAETVAAFLEETRAHAGLAIWPAGELALANVLRVMDLARDFEREGATSFRAFVEYLALADERDRRVGAPPVEEGTEGVRLLTVHKAKGLEFPVVVLCDPTKARTPQTARRHIDGSGRVWLAELADCAPIELRERQAEVLALEDAESVRLAYVAATRARDLLVVPAVGDDPVPGWWTDVLHPALYPPGGQRRDAQPAPGCPELGPDSVLARPGDAQRLRQHNVRPGLHRPIAGDHPVVWWDPHVLELTCEPDVGARQMELLREAPGERGAVGDQRHARWWSGREEAREAAARPTLEVQTFTARAASPAGIATSQALALDEVPGRDPARPAGKRFGVLVHAVLAEIPLDAERPAIERLAATHARLLDAPDGEIDAATEAVARALAHPLLQRARASSRCYRELPLVMPLPDPGEATSGALVEGVCDLAFTEPTALGPRWTVVDFKTDHTLDAERRPVYERQVRLYAAALSAATGAPADCALLLL